MSWVKVRQDNIELLIPYQAFKDVYEKNGFVLVEQPTHKPFNDTQKDLIPNGAKQAKGGNNGIQSKSNKRESKENI